MELANFVSSKVEPKCVEKFASHVKTHTIGLSDCSIFNTWIFFLLPTSLRYLFSVCGDPFLMLCNKARSKENIYQSVIVLTMIVVCTYMCESYVAWNTAM